MDLRFWIEECRHHNTFSLNICNDYPENRYKAKWQAADLDYLTDCLVQEPRTYNSVQLAQKLKQERLVDLSSDRLRRLLKKDIGGNAPDTATEKSKTPSKKPSNRQI
ncbi:MAG: hypothetical protein F6K42_35555 [Leptolyngbya sp. SIO1D8]|nr:hypothetical protein [Leptolyngbya sp. SIO1D8]